MIKAAFFDIDGTSYQNDIHDSPESTKVAFKKLKELGIKISVCTSRSYPELIKLPKHYYELMDAMVCAGGAQIVVDGKLAVAHKIDSEDTKNVIELFHKYNLDYRWTSVNGENHLSTEKEDVKKIFMHFYNMTPTCKPYQGEELVHLLYYCDDPKIKEEITKCCKNSYHLVIGYANEITAKNISKSHGTVECASLFGIQPDEIVAFGDGNNDIDMLQKATIGIAMGNAKQGVKDAADYVTENIENDGLYKACEHFNWFQE
ncbi:HAD family hydrolase [Anaerorhabdus furcosa]|uniref:Cof subfamily of IIB subfamily of haloacid dehalogenase superfamily/HAD-superfamily hydrolase, subfamily IIB n=1 Tax=Anaerorhabdus furcosa TaxID=118967 RepID=A0A1T4MW13_9FIRM|nr:HAD family hydrolase [Anaerorhabdus furcosa]SJZ71101.1 hypothetical protein SAMN02745191_1436 [Anaerorhabdus furcosa]